MAFAGRAAHSLALNAACGIAYTPAVHVTRVVRLAPEAQLPTDSETSGISLLLRRDSDWRGMPSDRAVHSDNA